MNMNKIISLLALLLIGCAAAAIPEPTITACVVEQGVESNGCVTLPLSYGEGIFKELKDHNCKVKKPYWHGNTTIIIQALCPPEDDA